MRKGIFSQEIVNSGRQQELDIAKFLVLFVMPLVHCTIECTSKEGLAHGLPYFFDTIIGGPLGAPVFMFAMGVGMVYTHHGTPADFVRRGGKMLLTGYLLNVCRYLIPFLTGYIITGDAEKYIEALPYYVFGNDILPFAGLAFLMMAVLHRLHFSDGAMLLFSLGLSLVGNFCNGIDAGSPFWNIVLGNFIGTEDAAGLVRSDFPLMNWLLVPVCGYLFGKRLLHVADKRRFYRLCSSICLIAAGIYFLVGIHQGTGMFGEGQNCYYHIRTPDVLAALAAVVGLLGVYDKMAGYLPAKVMEIVQEGSRNINQYYCIHWVLVVWITNVWLSIARGGQELPMPLTLCLGCIISVCSFLIARLWSKRRRYTKEGFI